MSAISRCRKTPGPSLRSATSSRRSAGLERDSTNIDRGRGAAVPRRTNTPQGGNDMNVTVRQGQGYWGAKTDFASLLEHVAKIGPILEENAEENDRLGRL